jgi:hypothetical protein
MDSAKDEGLRQRLLEVLSDARLYLEKSHVAAALDILAEDTDSFAHAPDLADKALRLVNTAYLYFGGPVGNDPGASEKAVEQFFHLAAACFPPVRALDPTRLGLYKRALLLTKASALPLRRERLAVPS